MGDVGGALGWDGAILLQGVHCARMSLMAGVMPGQKTEDSALEHICVVL